MFYLLLPLLLSPLLASSASECICLLVYSPICASNGIELKTFSNECFARCGSFHFAYLGSCVPSAIKNMKCVEECPKELKQVCGLIGIETRIIPNLCIAQCLEVEIVDKSLCNNVRILGLSDWWKTTKTVFGEALNSTKEAAKNAVQTIANKTKEIANATKNAVQTVVNKTANAIEAAKNKTVEIAQKVVNVTKNVAETIKNKTQEAASSLANNTKTLVGKISNKTKEIANKTKNFFKTLASRIVTRLRQTKEGIQNCTCHIVSKVTDDLKNLFEKLENSTISAVNNTKTKIAQIWNNTRDGVIAFKGKIIDFVDYNVNKAKNGTYLIVSKTKNAFKRTEQWFKNLVGCGCGKEWKPVCVEADGGEEATLLNKCYADCVELKVKSNGKCKGEEKVGLEIRTE